MDPIIPLVISIISLVWLAGVTVVFLKFYRYFTHATPKGKKFSILEVLDRVLQAETNTQKDIKILQRRCANIEKDLKLNIQKIGLLRFNPFRDTGGDQSFILALLDANDTGVVISGLHTRTGTRWYAKQIHKGKSLEHELSKDEEKTIKNAKTLDEQFAKV